MVAHLINPRWIDIPEDDIVRLLNQAGDEVWQDKIIGGSIIYLAAIMPTRTVCRSKW